MTMEKQAYSLVSPLHRFAYSTMKAPDFFQSCTSLCFCCFAFVKMRSLVPKAREKPD